MSGVGTEIDQVVEELRGADKFLLTTHENPDGDALGSLRRFKEDVREVTTGMECGIVLENFADVKEGDLLEVYETRQVEKTLQ